MSNDYKRFLILRKASLADPKLCAPPKKADSAVYQRVYASAGAANALASGDAPLSRFVKIEREAMFHAGMMKDDENTETVLTQLNTTMRNFERLTLENPHLEDDLLEVFGSLVRNYGSMIRDFVLAQGGREKSTMRPLIERNNAKAATVEHAKRIAVRLWETDKHQEIRIGDMAERVYRALVQEGFAEDLPGTAERVKAWIKPVAPEYARKGGRRPKT
jgi:hypothetical protein